MNILVKNPGLPQKAWKANLHFLGEKELGSKGKELPFREEEDIYLPLNENAEFYPLKLGTQFLFATFRDESRTFVREVYFGGTDERPFLVRLDERVFKAYEYGGEDEFFPALKPREIKIIEKLANKEAKRQGDFFFISIPNFSWKSLMTSEIIYQDGNSENVKMLEYDEVSIFDTRHTLTGVGLHTKSFSHSMGEIVFIEGILRAPDHEDQILKGPHAIMQAANLYDPKKAD